MNTVYLYGTTFYKNFVLKTTDIQHIYVDDNLAELLHRMADFGVVIPSRYIILLS